MSTQAWLRRLLGSARSTRGENRRALDFFIVGAQKSGTTALVEYLRRHPALQIATIKEIHFFDDEAVDWSRPDYERMHAHFDWDDPATLVRGEGTPIYMYWPRSMERLQRYNPDAKIILCLRHPAYRAHSHWRMENVFKSETLSFEDAVSEVGRGRVREAPDGVHRVHSYVERGLYADQVRRVQSLFPRDQVLYLRTDDLWIRTQQVVDEVQRFIGVPRELKVASEYIVPVNTVSLGTMPPAALATLNDLFASDLKQAERLTKLPLTRWLDPGYREPMAVTPS